MPAQDPVRVLFVCTENAARSQMAEALLRFRGGDAYQVFSAGAAPTQVHPLALRVLDEIGIDASDQRSEGVDAYRDADLDYVITLCDGTREMSPSLRAKEMVIHRAFDDPAVPAPEDEQLAAFRRVRDAIADYIDRLFLMQTA